MQDNDPGPDAEGDLHDPGSWIVLPAKAAKARAVDADGGGGRQAGGQQNRGGTTGKRQVVAEARSFMDELAAKKVTIELDGFYLCIVSC